MREISGTLRAATLLTVGKEVPGTSVEEMELVTRSKAGDVEAFATLVRRYQDRLYNLAYRMLGNADDACDMVQESFMAAFEGLGGFRGDAAFYTWLYRVAVNKCLAHRRARAGKREFAVGGSDATPLETAGSKAVTPDIMMERLETGEAVQRAIMGLPEDYRVVVVLKDVEGFEYEEIAEMAGIALGTVKSRLHRARLLLREALEPYVG